VPRLAAATEGFSGADLKRLAEDGKALYAFDKVRGQPAKRPTEYFLADVETLWGHFHFRPKFISHSNFAENRSLCLPCSVFSLDSGGGKPRTPERTEARTRRARGFTIFAVHIPHRKAAKTVCQVVDESARQPAVRLSVALNCAETCFASRKVS
jgi:hypothetical protein